ncbi:hypothetical protein [Gloeothece verrucosa]
MASLAWADGKLAAEEVNIIISRLSRVFSRDSEEQERLQQELKDYLLTDVDIDNLLKEITSDEERELILKLGYQVISVSSDETQSNEYELRAYQRLVEKLNLPTEVVQQIEAKVTAGVNR